MNPQESEIYDVQNFITTLNSKKNSIVVVEGKRDEEALKKLGFSGRICQFHSFKGLTRFVDSMPRYKSLILLLDLDRKGSYLTKRIISQLQHRMRIDLSFRRKLVTITKGKVRHIENLTLYADL
ncbi:MAG: toprim domain-containing protein [Nitrosotalea sp.]